MDHHNFSHGTQNRAIQGNPAGAGQSQHPLLSANASLFGQEPVHSLESLAAMEHLIAQQTALQMAENRVALDQFSNMNGNIDLRALRGNSALAQLQAQANQEAVASEIALRIAKLSRADEAVGVTDQIQRHQLLQQHALLSHQQQQQQQQQQQLEAIQRANTQFTQNIIFQDNVEQRNRELAQIQEEAQILELIRVRQDLMLQRHKQEEGLKVAAIAAAATQQAQNQNLLASYNDFDRLQALRQLNLAHANTPTNSALNNGNQNTLPLATAAALGIFGQRDINDLNILYQNQQTHKLIASSRVNNANKTQRLAAGIPSLPKKFTVTTPTSKENVVISQESFPTAATKVINASNPPKKKKPKVVKRNNIHPDSPSGKTSIVVCESNPSLSPNVTYNKSQYNNEKKKERDAPPVNPPNQVKQTKSVSDVKKQQSELMNSNEESKTLLEQIRQKSQHNEMKRATGVINTDNIKTSPRSSDVSREQQLRFFNNGVETHMDGSPLGNINAPPQRMMTNKTHLASTIQVPNQVASETLKRRGNLIVRMKSQESSKAISQVESSPFHLGDNMKVLSNKTPSILSKPNHSKKTDVSSLVPPLSTTQTGIHLNDSVAPHQLSKEKQKLPKTNSSIIPTPSRSTMSNFNSNEITNIRNPTLKKPFRLPNRKNRETASLSPGPAPLQVSLDKEREKFSMSNTAQSSYGSTSTSDCKLGIIPPKPVTSAPQSYVMPENKKKKANISTNTNLAKKRKVAKSSSQSLKHKLTSNPAMNLKNTVTNSSNATKEYKPNSESSDNHSFPVLAQKRTRSEFFSFVIDLVPELKSSVTIIQGRFKGDGESFVPLPAINLILAELHYLANMDGANSARKKKVKEFPQLLDKSSLRIKSCILQIERYKNAYIENLSSSAKRDKKKLENSKSTSVLQSRNISIPAASATFTEKMKSDLKPHRQSMKISKVRKQPKTLPQSTENQVRRKQPWDEYTKTSSTNSATNQTIKLSSTSRQPHVHQIKMKSSIRQCESNADKERKNSNGNKDCKIEPGALNAARALLNFGAK